MSQKLERKYGLFTAICMVVGIVMGSGVFFKAQTILDKSNGNIPIGVLAWFIGGCIMMVCLMTFSFMAQKYERVNGLVDYAETTVGPKYGYMTGWFTATIYFPSMTAALAWLTARYTMEFITSVNPSFPMLIPVSEGGCLIGPECIVLTLFFLCTVYVINAISPKIAGKLQTSTTIIKLIPLAAMSIIGIIYGLYHQTLQENIMITQATTNASSNPLLASVCATAFAYEGWIIAVTINSEIKDSKKTLPRALIIGGIIIITTYVLYFLGVSGAASKEDLINKGATLAYTNIFGGFLGNVLNLFVAVSCLGTCNGLMLGCTRSMYALASRDSGPNPSLYKQVDNHTNVPTNSALFALLVIVFWLVYFYFSNLAGLWSGPFVFDCTELPVLSIYMMYIPIFIQWIKKEKDENIFRRVIMPVLAIAGCLFMTIASVLAHGEACIWYIIVYIAIMAIGLLLYKKKK